MESTATTATRTRLTPSDTARASLVPVEPTRANWRGRQCGWEARLAVFLCTEPPSFSSFFPSFTISLPR